MSIQIIMLYVLILLVIIYLLIVIPGKKKNKKMRELHEAIKVGDEIVTMGGIIATVKNQENDILTVEIDSENNVCMKILVYSVSVIC